VAQHDYSIANQSGSSFRADLNNALSAVVSQNSGSAEPTTMFAYQTWADTTAGVMKMRNGANSAWITLYELDGTFVTTDIKLGLGTAATPSLTFTGDLNTGIYSPGADQVSIATNGTQRVTVDASGRMGVGSTVPDTLLSVRNDTNDSPTINSQFVASAINSQLRFKTYSSNVSASNTVHHRLVHKFDTNENNGYIDFFRGNALDGGFLGFGTNGSEKARIDASGRLLVGTGTGRGVGVTIQASTQVETTTYVAYSAVNNTNDAGGTALMFGKSRGTAIGSNTIVQSGDSLGDIYFAGADGTDLESVAARITCSVDGTPGANDMPGRLVFSTTADGAASPTERMRIDSAGNTYIKTMAVGGTANMHWSSSAGQLFVTSSSERFKHDIVDYDKGLAEVMQMQPKYFVYNEEPNQKQRAGFIAEDFHDLGLTEYVEYWNDDEGNASVPSEIGYSNMVAILVKSIQQQQAMITELQAKVAALEAK
jgi:hypothetical protein